MRGLLLFVALTRVAAAEEARWNVHLELGPTLTLEQPTVAVNDLGFATGGAHVRPAVELQLHDRVGLEAAYSLEFLIHPVSSSVAVQQGLLLGARVRPWFNRRGGFVLPRPQDRHAPPLSAVELFSDLWVDLHIGASLLSGTRLAYDVGLGTRLPLIFPLQLGLFVRWQQLLLGGDDISFKQILFGITGSLGFLPVHPDGDGDGVRDSADRCPDSRHGTPVNSYGCEIESLEAPTPNP